MSIPNDTPELLMMLQMLEAQGKIDLNAGHVDSPGSPGTPVIVRHEDQIIVKVDAPDVKVTVESIPVTTNVQVHLQAARRDIILAVIALALIAQLFIG